MKPARPRSRAELVGRWSRYEVVLRGPEGEDICVGFTAQKTRRGLFTLIRSRGEEIIKVAAVTDDTEVAFRKNAGRWTADLGNGWAVVFTGRTERDVLAEEETR